MKRQTFISILVAIFILIPNYAASFPYLDGEPVLTQNMSWGLNVNGMLIVSYDTDNNGKADLHTLRVVTQSYTSKQSFDEVSVSFPHSLIFYVENALGRHFYVVVTEPLFYAIDINEDGHWDLLYKDPQQDGVNANEMFYESPSGMFTAQIAQF